MNLDVEHTLKTRFGLNSLRPFQREAVEGLMSGQRRVLLVAPTGGGKSLTYQLPATLLAGLTVVISPLVALMEDQVRGLEARGISATFFSSGLDADERRSRAAQVLSGKVKLLYCAPERLAYDGFVDLLARCTVDLVAIDEAHCISQWGHDFRPDYLRIGTLLGRLKPPRVLACTATATERVRQEIRAALELDPCLEIVRGFARPNLLLEAKSIEGPREGKKYVHAALRDALGSAKKPKGAAIVYCATRKATEAMADDLRTVGYDAAAYHAGLDPTVRATVNARFGNSELAVVAATNAFGMGIDRADVRVVVHAQPPSSLEAYYQEVGRGGRDGGEARGLLLCSGQDVALRRRMVEAPSQDGTPPSPEAVARAWGQFRDLLRYLDAQSCRHDFILRYFGDERETLGGCGHCDVCATLDDALDEDTDALERTTTLVRMALSGVARANKRGGLVAVVDMLKGDRNARIERMQFEQLSTFGLLKATSHEFIMGLLRTLLSAGWIDLTPTEHPVPYVTKSGWSVMRGEVPARVRLPREVPASPRQMDGRSSASGWQKGADANIKTRSDRPIHSSSPAARSKLAVDLSTEDLRVFEALRQVRGELARDRKVPAYVIAADSTLQEMARKRPRDEDELLGIRGMGPFRVESYGEALLEAIEGAG